MSPIPISILITGANQGLGYETAKYLLEHPNVNVFVGARNPDSLSTAIASLSASPGKNASSSAIPVLIDVTSDESIAAAVSTVSSALAAEGLEGLDVLVNNAGTSLDALSIPTREKMRRTYEVNVFGAACTTEAFLPLLRTAHAHGRRPRILNISSSLGRLASVDPRYAGAIILAYNTSKAALNGVTVHFSRVFPEARVVSICPGFVATNLNNKNQYATNLEEAEGPKFIATTALNTEGETKQFL